MKTLDESKNYHDVRVKQSGRFDSFSYKKTNKGVGMVIGWKNGKSKVQSYKFHKDKFTPAEARQWLKYHGVHHQKFEKAEGSTERAKKVMTKKTKTPTAKKRLTKKFSQVAKAA